MSRERELAQQEIVEVRSRIAHLDDNSLDILFRNARSHYDWQDKPVTDEQLHQIYELMKFAPTSNNGCPIRIIFVRTPESKARLAPAVKGNNVEKMMKAPVTAILAHDTEFYEQLPRLLPFRPEAKDKFVNDPVKSETSAFRNGTIQATFFLVAVRALGIDIGPVSGFDNDMVDAEFFKGTPVKSNFLCNIGYGDEKAVFEKLPRFDFDEVCEII